MSIKRLETQLTRLNAKIEQQQAALSELKEQRQNLKTRLAESKKAIKEGKPEPESESEGFTERIGAALNENVLEPIAEFLNPTPEKAKPSLS